ncbi:hypothetical protein [Mesorhizobium sp. SP-1A]|uniref:hypothetical protein n=1 Tax=Mesorhizobium sp. SP-1A TaxID=3077840 RepID=UPI0028F6F91C|nr:hypothetical protein [Mesorhizobium sp. SP-1A]
MALFNFRSRPFRVRSLQRDSETDSGRLADLCRFLDDFRAAIVQERDGLRARQQSVADRAAFSQQSLEEDQPDAAMSTAVDRLTDAMMRYDVRLRALERQIDFVTEMRAQVDRFPLENEEVGAPGKIAGN